MTYPVHAFAYVTPAGKPCDGAAEADGPPCHGTVLLTQTDEDKCLIEYEVKNLKPGEHGFHVHEKADFSNGCMSAGPHYNPFGKTHGGSDDEERHVGDLGNIQPGANGIAKGSIVDKLIKLVGEHSVIGRSFMVHADPDDLGKGGHELSKTTGNAGARIACGEIKTFPIHAECTVAPEGKPCDGNEASTVCTGIIRLAQTDPNTCVVSYDLKGMTPGQHGFHVHEKADFSEGCKSAGPHYNPFGKTHGGPADSERHVGDLGNVEANSKGEAKGEIVDSQVKLYGEYSVIGRSIIVHADPDDLGKGGHELSPTTGNAGARIACGEIRAK